MAQQVNDEEKNVSNDGHLWPSSLLLNQAYASAFACVKYVDLW